MFDDIINNAGYRKLEYITQDAVAAISIDASLGLVSTVSLKSGKVWTELYCSLYELDFNADIDKTDNGNIYKTKVTGFIPGTTVQVQSLLRPLLIPFEKYLLRLTDFDDQVRLIGSLSEGLSFSLRQNQEGHPGTKVGQQYSFEADLTQNSILFFA